MGFSLDKNKPILGIDVDLTTLRSDRAWWIWLKHMTMNEDLPWSIDEYVNQGHVINYDISTHFEKPVNENVEPLDFWRNEGVYDTIEPVNGAVECINELRDNFNIVFVTHNKGNGGRSKYNNLVRNFGRDNFASLVTKEKHMAKIDILVDDRNLFLNNCAETGVHSVKLSTPFVQEVEAHSSIIEFQDWYGIKSHLITELERGAFKQ